MSKAEFVEILGVQIPLRTLASVTSTPYVLWFGLTPNLFRKLCYDMDKALFDPDPLFKAIAERKVISIDSGVRRQFFTYPADSSKAPLYKFDVVS